MDLWSYGPLWCWNIYEYIFFICLLSDKIDVIIQGKPVIKCPFVKLFFFNLVLNLISNKFFLALNYHHYLLSHTLCSLDLIKGVPISECMHLFLATYMIQKVTNPRLPEEKNIKEYNWTRENNFHKLTFKKYFSSSTPM